jgi:TolA-binding protein
VSIVDLHPDDLFDKEARGALTAAERQRLDQHLAKCAVCRFERQARLDFAAELGEEDVEIDAPLRLALEGAGALHETAETPHARSPKEPPLPRASVRVRTRTRRWGLVTLLAAALFVTTFAAIAGWSPRVRMFVTHAFVGEQTTLHAPPAPALPPSTPRGAPVGALPASPASSAASLAMPAPAPALEDSPSPPDAVIASAPSPLSPPSQAALVAPSAPAKVAASPRAALTSRPARDAKNDARVAPSSPASNAEAKAEAKPEAKPAEDRELPASILFTRAGDARRRGERGAARTLYRELQLQYAGSAEAVASRAILGRMQLDEGDAPGALAQFDGYLAAGDMALREETMLGRAVALERMGQARDARKAWQDLLAAFPNTIHAARARARLEALGGR